MLPSIMVETKYALNTAVKTTVVYPEFAKSKLAHAKISDGFTSGLNELDRLIKFDRNLVINNKTFLEFLQVIYG